MPELSSRRDFLKQAAAGASLAALADAVLAGQSVPGATGLPTRVLGRTGDSSASPATSTPPSTAPCSTSRSTGTCQMPMNVMDASYRSVQKPVVPVRLEK